MRVFHEVKDVKVIDGKEEVTFREVAPVEEVKDIVKEDKKENYIHYCNHGVKNRPCKRELIK